ncbi:YciI family protein [Pseudonocardia humida]|nr:YciI family protein [Pseudonocardia humida]
MIMLYGSQQDYDAMAGRPGDKPPMSPEDLAAMHEHMGRYHQALVDSGELVDAQGLTAPVHARRVRLKGGAPVVTDGPYPETQEVLVGYTVVDVVGIDRAVEIAAGLVNPAAEGEYVDVRPIVDSVEELSL